MKLRFPCHTEQRKFLNLLILLLLSGCAVTYLDGPTIGANYPRLAAANKRALTVAVTGSNEELTLGHQYVLFAIPAGIVRAANPAQMVSTALFRTLAEQGFRPTVSIEPSTTPPDLEVALDNLSVTAYDLFFFRIVNCSVTLKGKLLSNGSAFETRSTLSEPRMLGFKPRLEACIESVLDEGTKKLLYALNVNVGTL